MRVTEKAAAVLILALSTWMVIMWAATSFQGYEANRMLRLELGSDAASLNQAVRGTASDAAAYNIQMVVRNTYMDYILILLYWLTFVSLSVLAGRMGQRVLGVCAAILISGAALNDMLENGAILTTMRLQPFTDAVAVDISEFSQWKWTFFFLASILLGLAVALNRRVSTIRRASGGLFIASGLFGLLGIMRYRVSLEYSMWMIDIGLLIFAGALALTLWKIYHSLKVHSRVNDVHRVHVHA